MTERKRPMGNFEATMLAEGQFDLAGYSEDEVTDELVLEAWQYLVDTGLAWQLQGSFGRQAKSLIDAGLIHEDKGRELA